MGRQSSLCRDPEVAKSIEPSYAHQCGLPKTKKGRKLKYWQEPGQ